MADPALTGLAGAIGGATVSQVLGYVFAVRRDRRADVIGQVEKLRSMLEEVQRYAAEDRDEIREALAGVREKVAGIEGVLRAVLVPPTPHERPRRPWG